MKKRRLVAIVLISFVAVAALAGFYTVWVTWYVPNLAPSITLWYPADGATINANTSWFNWTSSDPQGDNLTHVWYIDNVDTLNSPNLETNNTGWANATYGGPFPDGNYWWKVEVTDGDYIISSTTRSLTINTNPGNNFPVLGNATVYPANGTTSTTFTYHVTYTDADNDTPAYVYVFIDNVPHAMTLLPGGPPVDYTDGESYIYTTTLSPGWHWYAFNASDGLAVVSTGVQMNPYVTTANAPSIVLVSPSDGGTFTVANATDTYNVSFQWIGSDVDGDLQWMDLYIADNPTFTPYTLYNESLTQTETVSLGVGTWYWKVVAHDTWTATTSSTWHFTVSTGTKGNSVTIQPTNTQTQTLGEFKGNLVITNEGTSPGYEVYWYIWLKDVDETTIYSTDSGACWIATTIQQAYTLSVPVQPGSYKLVAKTFDAPDGTQLGQDTILVSVTGGGGVGGGAGGGVIPGLPIGEGKIPEEAILIEYGVNTCIFSLFFLAIAVLLLYFGIKKRKDLLIASGFILLFASLPFCFIVLTWLVVFGLSLMVLGCGLIVYDYRKKLGKLYYIAGLTLIIIGFFLYFSIIL